MKLENRVAIVTGGASGIGLATARLFAKEGASVTVADVNEEQGAAAARELMDAGGRALFVRCDVSVEEQVRTVIERTAADLGSPTVLFNNAGVAGPGGWDAEEAQINKVWAVNVNGVYWGIKHVLPYMRSAGGGVIINTASGAALGARSLGIPIYAASKAAVVHLTKTAAVSLAPYGIRVNTVAPGMIDTPMAPQFFPGVADPMAVRAQGVTQVPLGRTASPEEIARVVLFLASDDSSYVTGVVVPADGGRCAK